MLLACNRCWSLRKNCCGIFINNINDVPRHDNYSLFLSRRKLLSSSISLSSDDDVVSSYPISISRRSVTYGTKNLLQVICKCSPTATRRMLLASFFMFLGYHPPSRYLSAQALGDPSVTIEQVTPPVFTSGALFPAEERIVQLFEKNTYSVVNIFDVTLRPQLNVTGMVEIPEGNGSGVVWDEQGHIVTNYHVIGNALSRNPSPGQVVARVNILASEGLQKNFEGKLVGADRTKDLAVLKVEASEDLLKPIKVGQSSSLRVGQHGGPLLDSKGNLIGINTAIFTRTGTSAGVGFAIPSSTVLKIALQLIQFSKVVRAGLNVDIAPDVIANQLNVRNGALILQVPGNSLAAKAGLVPTTRGFAGNIVLGDIIVGVDSKNCELSLAA
ncbi:protease Do-like 8 [Populus alba x Populus x berolinensis]|uniref:Protease Do-like 8 n=1 Tax=Populus alba x Populus x berolinensis TaxID=444605 RepID=A0AAD6R3G8_9ROSI|nr:protease Do-like 8 [Populus alba x Populus x berolinensis]